MNDDLTPTEEQTLDVLLSETLGNAKPPDLSHQIFERLSGMNAPPHLVANDEDRSIKTRPRPSGGKGLRIAMVMAALAASLIAAIWLRSDHALQIGGEPDASIASAPAYEPKPSVSPPQTLPADTRQPQLADARSPKPRGVPMLIPPPGNIAPDPSIDVRQSKSRPSLDPPASVTLVSQQMDSELRQYWDAIGITPSEQASGEEVAERMALALGVAFPTDVLASADRLQRHLEKPEVSMVIARDWLNQITQNGIRTLSPKSRNRLVVGLTECFESGRPFDALIAGWIGGSNSDVSTFYAAISGGTNQPTDPALLRRLASLTMNVDVRCTRCHDAYIESTGRQEDYWAFAAFLRGGLARGVDGLNVRLTPGNEPVFYDLSDGRRRMAEPNVASRWINSPSDEPLRSVPQWADRLMGSPELARGVVNSLWQLVHDQPLRGPVVDPISAPHSELLERFEEHLAIDLMQSQFNVGRTLALIIASPATQRSVPASLEQVWVSNDEESLAAAGAFAAALPLSTHLPIRERLDQAMRSIGAKFDGDGSPLLAQIDERGTGNRDPEPVRLSWDFPDRAESLPVQWLVPIKDTQSRVDHLAYLAGLSDASANVKQAATAMQAAGVDEPTLLHRVWWLVRP